MLPMILIIDDSNMILPTVVLRGEINALNNAIHTASIKCGQKMILEDR